MLSSSNDRIILRAKSDKIIIHSKSIIQAEFQKLTSYDFRYFAYPKQVEYNKILLSLFIKEQVFIPSTVVINDKIVYNYKPEDRCFLYYYGDTNIDSLICKLYFVDRNKPHPRFITNDDVKIRGLHSNKNNNKIAVITKSFKDALNIASILLYLGLQKNQTSVNVYYFQGEATMLKMNEYNTTFSHYEKVYLLTDYDKTGILNALYHTKLSNKIKMLFIKSNDVILKPVDYKWVQGLLQFDDIIVTVEELNAILNSFKVRTYFYGLKDFTDLLHNRSFKYIYKLLKLIQQ
jgi:hypothetical protein